MLQLLHLRCPVLFVSSKLQGCYPFVLIQDKPKIDTSPQILQLLFQSESFVIIDSGGGLLFDDLW